MNCLHIYEVMIQDALFILFTINQLGN